LRREVWDARRAAFDRLRPRAAADHPLTRRLTNSATAPTTVSAGRRWARCRSESRGFRSQPARRPEIHRAVARNARKHGWR
jgi:hypothetical protein